MIFTVKDFIGESLVDKKVRIKCDCLLTVDFSGRVKGWTVDTKGVTTLELSVHGKEKQFRLGNPDTTIEIIE